MEVAEFTLPCMETVSTVPPPGSWVPSAEGRDMIEPSDSGGRMVKCTKKQIRELKTALRWKIPEAERRRIQMVLLRESGMTQPAIAEAMGVSLSSVNRAHMAFDHGGIKALKPKPIGGRTAREHDAL